MDHLIETVRRYPCLWNTSAIEYRDQELKDAAWAEVMKETDLSSVKEVKLKWKKLRDSYRDALKRQSDTASRALSGRAAAKKHYPWKYAGLMHFLQPHMGNRRKPAGAPVTSRNGGRARSDDSDSESESDRAPPPAEARRPPPDPLDIFFNSMCQTTKRLPFQTQIQIKRSLFEAVTAAEEALLAAHAHGYARSSSAASSERDADVKPR